MPLFPFRSSSVKAKGSSGGGSGGTLLSKNRGSRGDGQTRTSASINNTERRRRSSPDGDAPSAATLGVLVKRESRSRDPVSRPPPTRRGRSPPKRRSTYRSSLSPPSQRDTSRDEIHLDRRPESLSRRRYSSAELTRPQRSPSTSKAPALLKPPSPQNPDRRNPAGGYTPHTPAASASSIPHRPDYEYPPIHAGNPPRYSTSTSRHSRPPNAGAAISPRPRPAAPSHSYHGSTKPIHKASTSHAAHSSGEVDGIEGFLKRFPNTFSTYAAVKELSKHADKAREWVEWFNTVNGAPYEIRLLSSKVKIAKDTVTQIQDSLEARPDLIEDEPGQNLKMQIEEVIDGTTETLKKMSKLLSGFTAAVRQDETALGRLEGFWQSFNYKNEGESQIKATDAELQIQLSELTLLMSNIYARALRSPGPSSPKVIAASAHAMPTQPTIAIQPLETPLKSNTPVMPSPKTMPNNSILSRENKSLRTEAISSRSNFDSPCRLAVPILDTPPVSPQNASNPNEGSKRREISTTAGSDRNVMSYPLLQPYASPGNQRVKEIKSPPASNMASNMAPNWDPNCNPDSTFDLPSTVPALPQISIDSIRPPSDILLDATWEGDLRAVSDALRFASPSTCDPRNLTPLHLAAERDHMAVAMMLLDRGADVHARADGGCTPLHLAARYASADTVEMLIDRAGADPNCRTSDGRTPLHYATRSAKDGDEERREVIRTLRDMGADPTLATRRGETPRDVAQKRDFWDAAATLRRAETKWEETHLQQGGSRREVVLKMVGVREHDE